MLAEQGVRISYIAPLMTLTEMYATGFASNPVFFEVEIRKIFVFSRSIVSFIFGHGQDSALALVDQLGEGQGTTNHINIIRIVALEYKVQLANIANCNCVRNTNVSIMCQNDIFATNQGFLARKSFQRVNSIYYNLVSSERIETLAIIADTEDIFMILADNPFSIRNCKSSHMSHLFLDNSTILKSARKSRKNNYTMFARVCKLFILSLVTPIILLNFHDIISPQSGGIDRQVF